ncbi:MAG TPA: hypothetical protein PKW95_19050 [bacterium]|nr:hypothetical protein [bacterium]
MTGRMCLVASILLLVLACSPSVWAQAQEPLVAEPAAEADEVIAPEPEVILPAPPQAVVASDTSSDGGGSITVVITPSIDEDRTDDPVVSYEVLRAACRPEEFKSVGQASAWRLDKHDPKTRRAPSVSIVDSDCKDDVDYFYQVVSIAKSGRRSEPLLTEAVQSVPQWFAFNKLNLFVIAAIISVAIIFFIESIKRGKKPFVRKIAGLEAVDEAIGRATEMGRPILYIPGIQDMNDVQTVSSVIILGRIARTIAEYDTKLMVPTSRSLVMTTARETVKEAYLTAGRPDAYHDDMITYLTDEQFGYVAGVNGIMVREKPATCFYIGAFFAESLILAETGNYVGAIQIAGTAMPSQLPFFIAACDYTLIGEELFAASAYLSQEPKQLGSLKGQDVGKAIAMMFILAGSLLVTLATLIDTPTLWAIADWVRALLTVEM